MKFTRFEKLELAIQELGGSKVSREFVKALSRGEVDVNSEDLISGDAGIYYLSPAGALTRVIIHIVDKDIQGRHFNTELRRLIDKGQFDDDSLVESLHKFHLVRCSTIERAESERWRDRYKMSNRRDGRFYYRFISDSDVYKELTDQRLFICMNCLSKITDAGVIPRGMHKQQFVPKIFFEYADADKMVGIEERGEYGSQSVPNKYAKDWRLIADNLKKNKGFQCEGVDCPHRDLSAPAMRKYLHAHHKDLDKSNNDFSNLEALCVYCHANEPNHSHMKGTRQYKEYSDFVLSKKQSTGI